MVDFQKGSKGIIQLLAATVLFQVFASLLFGSEVSRNVLQYYDVVSFHQEHANSHQQDEELLNHSKSIIPVWMEEYLDWHSQQRRFPTNETKYLVVRCLVGEKCGGVSDRLKSLPTYVLLANVTNRVLLFYWEKPAALEEFLVPPRLGMDWRLEGTNVTMEEIRRQKTYHDGYCVLQGKDYLDCVATHPNWSSERVLTVRARGGYVLMSWEKLFHHVHGISTPGLGVSVYRPGANVSAHHDLVEDIFRITFQPSPAVGNAIQKEMNAMKIEPKQYVTAHVRAKSPKFIPKGIVLGNYTNPQSNWMVDMRGGVVFEGRAKDYLVKLMKNAVNCAAQVAPGLPIYVASDTNEIVQYMVEESNSNSSYSRLRIVAPRRTNGDTTLHVDYDGNVGRNVSDFYPTFVDMFVMSGAKCTSFGVGGFTVFPIRIGGIHCTIQHRINSALQICPQPSSHVLETTSANSTD